MTPVQLDLLARESNPPTSQAAAKADRSSIEQRAFEIIALAGQHGATTDEVHNVMVAEGWGHRWSSTSRRISSLLKARRVETCGTRAGEFGRQQQVVRRVSYVEAAS